MLDLILASASPRRAELLDQIGVRHRRQTADVDETPLSDETPEEYVLRLALAKARAVLRLNPEALVLGADTCVVRDGKILGKPADASEAERMLLWLAGRSHQVLTGIALVGSKGEQQALSASEVRFRAFDRDEALAYVATGEPLDKAGAYGIQGRGALLIECLNGSYSGVMGLPLYETGALLAAAGVGLWT